MKISKADFESMKAKYDKEDKKGKPAKGKKGKDKDNQTSWIFVDRGTLEGLLAKADDNPTVGGVQFYFTEFTEEMAEKVYPGQAVAYTGQMTLVMRSANLKENKLIGGEEDEYETGGMLCPYICEPEPTDS